MGGGGGGGGGGRYVTDEPKYHNAQCGYMEHGLKDIAFCVQNI